MATFCVWNVHWIKSLQQRLIIIHQTIPIRKWPLIIPFPSGSGLWSDHSHPEVTSDQTIPIRKWPLIILSPDRKWPLIRPFPSGSGLWSDHSHPEAASDQTIPRPFPSGSDLWSDHSDLQVTYDQTIPIRNQNPDPVIMVWEHTVCVGLRMIRGHFRMAPQPGQAADSFMETGNGTINHWHANHNL